MFISESILVDTLLGIATLLGLLYFYLTSTFNYWKKKGVPYVKPTIIFGNLKEQFFLQRHLFYVIQDIYNNFNGARFGGYFESRTPVLMICDPALVERILIKDFLYFQNRDFAVDVKQDPLSETLFGLKGRTWRNLRNKLTPTFTTGKLKGMVEQICNSGDDLMNEIEKSTEQKKPVDAKKLGIGFTIDVIASCAFGLQFKLDTPEGKQFRKMMDSISNPSTLQTFRLIFVFFFKRLAKLLGLRQVPQHINDYIIGLVKQTMQFREKNNIQRADFMQLMMSIKDQTTEGQDINWKHELTEDDEYLNQMDYSSGNGKLETGLRGMTDECIAAQSFVFLTAGSDPTANTITFVLYELAFNPLVQKQLQQEIDLVLQKYGGKMSYESMKDMAYLDLVIQETNRKYSLAGFMRRMCSIPYQIPGTDVVIEKGTKIVIPMHAIHNDPYIYPEPEKFIPERFEGNNHRSNGGKYLPFGDGPRICIAMRFALLEVKACVAMVMSKYSVKLDQKTQVPLRFSPKIVSPTPCGGIWIQFQKRT
ncbi:hypothetical protein J6590_016413 [Homalodisca vitripennis]|nr:hypothetical protein J6590_016413 [Homalodisca vitripennis]